jgi:hypothetical protein
MALPEGGERVVLVTDRRIGFWEAANQPRLIDYPFTVIELHLNRDGEGEGKMSIATKSDLRPERKHDQPGKLSDIARAAHQYQTRAGHELVRSQGAEIAKSNLNGCCSKFDGRLYLATHRVLFRAQVETFMTCR